MIIIKMLLFREGLGQTWGGERRVVSLMKGLLCEYQAAS